MASLLLLDSASLYFRAYYGVPPDSMTAPDGTPVNAVRGLLDMIARLIRARHPGRLIACMDADWRPAFRVAAIGSYKQHRANPDGSEQGPAELPVQIPVIYDVLAAAGVTMAAADGYEADDVIGTLAARAAERDLQAVIVSGDKDFYQLIGPRVVLLNPGRGGPAAVEEQWVDPSNASELLGFPPERFVDYLALVGDSSDNIPGVKGVGEKTALELLAAHGNLSLRHISSCRRVI